MTVDREKPLEVKIVRKNPNSVLPVYANDMLASYSDKELFLTFSLLEPPTGYPDELKDLKELPAIAVSKLVLTPEFAETVLKVLSGVIEQYKNRKK